MSKDGSVAPRERVNIVYESQVGGAQEEVELPLRFLSVGDFTGRADDKPVEQRELVNVNKDNFDEVLAGQRVGVDLDVDNRLADDGPQLSVSLELSRIGDFSPDAVCAQVPELRSLVALRDALTVLKGPLGNVPDFRKRLQALVDDPETCAQLLAELGAEENNDE